MESSLIPEQPLLISPSLAATIGLEEAILLAVLSDAALHQVGTAYHLNRQQIQRRLPFWSDADVQRISKNLQEKGIVTLTGAPYLQSQSIAWCFSEGVLATEPSSAATPSAPQAPRPAPITGRQSNQIAPNWQPDSELMAQLAQYSIPDYFIRQQVPEFVTYWRERAEAHHAWGNKFLKQVVRRWREHQTGLFQRDQDTAMTADWRPSRDAVELLVRHSGISLTFVEDAIPEFVLYWQERGEIGRTWNSKFTQHVKRQWARFTSAIEHDTEPKRIPDNWQPSEDAYDVLTLANIDLEFAKRQVAEFVLFWRESNKLYSSWNTKFLQHVKYHWARQHALTNTATQGNHHVQQQPSAGASATRDRSLIEDLTDRSWAS
ncbi:DnaT-like ssDNA-binding domain-containing protein [Gilvimarinus sp. SDUM040013]|uniref:DnaT-like ssDNA-binding domain-containing protein n=1 Tax=Gilvimarinus gilvus TaxID=3058038 RepID=A0ABU4S032_9GAMM|nr:DnaT-like ssDNA-binding domain-containing protein [Gilvimarinus sp. SDUM040013]MDO3387365.1 DnaT-like ssDNA-binding domain-containing protein [Gilvimarinus sp. SDUM040013]MDX6849842.1 DnaT-like ssDNA-binding domain-containing protein [Gilvimarinus sp. SDUM040013]